MRRKRLPTTLSRQEQALLLGVLHDRTKTGLRNLALVRIMLNAGLRACEVHNLKIADVDWNSGKLLINGKGKKQRTLWLAAGPGAPAPLAGDPGSPASAGPASFFYPGRSAALRAQPAQVLAGLVKKAGLDKRVHPHALRHTFATDPLKHTIKPALGAEGPGPCFSRFDEDSSNFHRILDECSSSLKFPQVARGCVF
jgi:site-specific recombinase XerD